MEDELRVKEKRLKLDEEARQLGVLLESEMGRRPESWAKLK